MGKFCWISLIASSLLLAQERIELYGTTVDANGSVITASGDPVILYQNQILSADQVTFDKNTSVIEAKGSVNLFRGGQYHGVSEYSRVNLLDDTRYSTPYYSIDQESGVWISALEANGCQETIDLTNGTVSGCDSVDPLWKIRFTSGDYDSDDMWVNLYNARLEIGKVPVFYLPYFGYPTDRTRRSGLLIPTFGISNSEGIYYQQPIYFAPHHWWDMELRPQIRTLRGEGIYADFRFVDTPSSQGSITMGYFREKESYASEYDMANPKHYGYGIKYQHRAPLREWFDLKLSGESGLYIDGIWMNDVEYLNLQKSDETQNVTTNQLLSRINLYYNSEDNYIGSYFKHYQYLDKASNDETLQTLPSLHYHRYLESFFDDYLLISADAMATHYYRPNGKRGVEGTFILPAMLQSSWFDDLIETSYTLNLSSKVIGFYAGERPAETASLYEQGKYVQLDHTFAVGSSLIKPYGEDLTHVINPFASYTAAGSRYYGGYYETYRDGCDVSGVYSGYPCEFYTLTPPSDTLSIGVNNYVFKNGSQVLLDRLSQNFRYDEQKSYYEELQNELEWQITEAVSFYNQTAYNHDRKRITKEQNTLRYNGDTVSAGVSHYYTDQLRNMKTVYTSYWIADAAYQYDRHYRFFGNVAYDYTDALLKRSEVGFMYTQRCFDFGVRYVQNRRPILTNAGSDNFVDDSFVFVTVILKPIGGSEFNYKLNSE